MERNRGIKKAKGPLVQLNLDQAGIPPDSDPKNSEMAAEKADASAHAPEAPVIANLRNRPGLLYDLLRLFLILLSLVVAAGFALILLQQPTVDKMAQDLQARRGIGQQEKIALLYLGDEIKDDSFHIRGAVRNISTTPLEQLDAAVRLYSHDGSILETTVLRMNKETIVPDEVAQFELVYPNYKMEFAKYSVEFKLRDGGMVFYKDMRATR
jgi:hypothetical protein